MLSKPWASNVLISPHLYPPSVSTHREVDQVTGSGLFARLSNSFGYLTKKGVCSTASATPKCRTFPVVFGETGSKFTDSLDLAMLQDFAKYMRSEDEMHYPIPNMFWWSWNANSGDTGKSLFFSPVFLGVECRRKTMENTLTLFFSLRLFSLS